MSSATKDFLSIHGPEMAVATVGVAGQVGGLVAQHLAGTEFDKAAQVAADFTTDNYHTYMQVGERLAQGGMISVIAGIGLTAVSVGVMLFRSRKYDKYFGQLEQPEV